MSRMESSAILEALQEVTNQVAVVVTETERDAVKRREGLGNADRTSQKQQLRSLKSSTVNLSQKVMFAEATANWAPNQSLKAEADRAAAAVDHAEDELKDWKNVAKQEEQQLQAGFALARTQHASYQAMNARIQQKLEALKKQEALQQQAQAALDAATATGSLNSQGASSARLAHESSRGAELDAQVAAGHVAVVEAEVAVAAEQEELLALEDELRRMEAEELSDARQQRREDSYKSWGIHMSRLTGVKSVVCIPFERRVDMEILPLQGSLTGAEQIGAEDTYKLSIFLQPGDDNLVQSACIEPQVIDMAPLTAAAVRRGKQGLALLVTDVLQALRQ